MTQAFRLLGDPRCRYVELPRYRHNPTAYKYVFRNNLRAAYIRHLALQNPSIPDLPEILAQTQDRRYVALHHFHPHIVQAFYSNPLTKGAARKHKVPISITEHELNELGLEVFEDDRILSLTGKPTGGYYFCPGYSQAQAHEDLKALIKKERGLREAVENERNHQEAEALPVNIEIRSRTTETADIVTTNLESKNTTAETPISTDIQMEQNTRNPDSQAKLAKARLAPSKQAEDNQSRHANERQAKQAEPIHVRYAEKIRAKHTEEIPATNKEEIPTRPTEAINADQAQGMESKHTDGAQMAVVNDAADQMANLNVVVMESKTENDPVGVVPDARNSEFDDIWAGNGARNENAVSNYPLVESEETVSEAVGNIQVDEDEADPAPEQSAFVPSVVRSVSRDVSHPWQTTRYRRNFLEFPEEPEKRISLTPAEFIDPTRVSYRKPTGRKDDTEPTTSIVQERVRVIDRLVATQKPASLVSVSSSQTLESLYEEENVPLEVVQESSPEPKEQDPPGNSPSIFVLKDSEPNLQRSPSRIGRSRSNDSTDSGPLEGVKLQQKMPGFDPTMRIQVHNSLIAWESRRRSEISKRQETYGQRWTEVKSVAARGIDEIDLAERFVSGFSKAGILFSDATQAVCDDTWVEGDDWNAFGSSFIPARLQKKSAIENADLSSGFGQSVLLTSILSLQSDMAQNFRDISSHIDEEILPELQELRATILKSLKDCERLGDGIMSELMRSEIELKNIWGKSRAVVAYH